MTWTAPPWSTNITNGKTKNLPNSLLTKDKKCAIIKTQIKEVQIMEAIMDAIDDVCVFFVDGLFNITEKVLLFIGFIIRIVFLSAILLGIGFVLFLIGCVAL